MKTRTANYVAFFAALLFMYGCATSNVAKKNAKNGPAGAWVYTVRNTPDGDVSGTMNIQKSGEEYTGNLSSNEGTIDLKNVTIEDNKLSSNFYYQGSSLQLTGVFSENTFTGSVDAGGQSFPLEATRTTK